MPSEHPAARTYADHLREWEAARAALDSGDVPPEVLLEAAKNLLDATAFKDSASLRRQTEIVQRIGASRG